MVYYLAKKETHPTTGCFILDYMSCEPGSSTQLGLKLILKMVQYEYTRIEYSDAHTNNAWWNFESLLSFVVQEKMMFRKK